MHLIYAKLKKIKLNTNEKYHKLNCFIENKTRFKMLCYSYEISFRLVGYSRMQ